jgi:predicted RNA-binding Zn ribbon-like protein
MVGMFQDADDPVALAVDLANTWDELEEPFERLPDVGSLQRFLERHGHPGPAARGDLARVRALRDTLRAAFAARDEERAVATLNAALEGSRARPKLERRGDGWAITWSGGVSDVLAASTAMSLLEAIRDDGWERFGTCAGAPCCCVFVDRSKNRSRRYCSDLCADRVAQAAHRARRRTAR